jgi:hypothetical protein
MFFYITLSCIVNNALLAAITYKKVQVLTLLQLIFLLQQKKDLPSILYN